MPLQLPEDLIDLIKELIIIEEEKKRKKEIEEEEYGERLYDYEYLPLEREKKPEQPIKIEISLE